MVVKFDMSKAYDQVEWPHLKAAMKALAFADDGIRLVMTCVSWFNIPYW